VPEILEPETREIGIPTSDTDGLNLTVVPAELVAVTLTERNFPAWAWVGVNEELVAPEILTHASGLDGDGLLMLASHANHWWLRDGDGNATQELVSTTALPTITLPVEDWLLYVGMDSSPGRGTITTTGEREE
jgi:hypothetical protein